MKDIMRVPVLLYLFLSAVFSTNASAHGGGVDAMGGHNNRKAGNYHFHRGPLADQTFSSKVEATNALKRQGAGNAAPAATPVPPGTDDQNITGVASVIDGDTLEIHSQRIRLHGIDAPESAQVCVRDGNPWRCGQSAATALSEKIGRQTVRCEGKDKDRYGRIVAVCHAGGIDLNGWLVTEGLAVAYRQYSSDYVGVEGIARETRRGVWASEFEMPWDWRKKKRK